MTPYRGRHQRSSLWIFMVVSAGIALTTIRLLPLMHEMPAYYEEAFALLANGQAISDFFPVGYSLFLALAMFLSESHGIQLFQGLIYCGVVALAYQTFSSLGIERKWLSIATALVMLHPYLILNIVRVNDNAVNVGYFLILFYHLVLAYKGSVSPLLFGTAGVFSSLLFLVRPNALSVIPLVLYCLAKTQISFRQRAVGVAVFGVAFMGVWLAASTYTGEAVFFPSNGPYNLYAGSNSYTSEYLIREYNAEYSIPRALKETGSVFASQAEIYKYDPARFTQLSFQFMREHPVDFLIATVWKIINLVRPDFQFADTLPKKIVQVWIMFPIYGWLIALGFAGLKRLDGFSKISVLFVALYMLPFVLTNSDPRFRLPVDVIAIACVFTVPPKRPFPAP